MSESSPSQKQTPQDDPELEQVVDEEEVALDKVHQHLRERQARPPEKLKDYAQEMLDLRDEIAAARLEDQPPLLEQMGRLESLSKHRRESSQGVVDPRCPYFGHLGLKEGKRERDVFIGRSTYLDTQSGVRIVDWRDAPVSRLYYRYEEGDDYDEVFGDREVTGEVLKRRSLTIVEGALRRIGSVSGTFSKNAAGTWRRLDQAITNLEGGQGTALRIQDHHQVGKLGIGAEGGSDDKHLKEITPLIDRRQFDLITRPDSGLVVIQGGAGSGKTTIGLHRLAYLAYQDTRRFRTDRMLVIVFNNALARYVAQVLPALGVSGVGIRTYENWAERLRRVQFPRFPRIYSDETPSVVSRFKKHPAMLKWFEGWANSSAEAVYERIKPLVDGELQVQLNRIWKGTVKKPLLHRLHALKRFAEEHRSRLSVDARVGISGRMKASIQAASELEMVWAELLSDRTAIGKLMSEHAPGEFTATQLDKIHAWCSARCSEALVEMEIEQEPEPLPRSRNSKPEETPREHKDPAEMFGAVDGREDDGATLDREDDTLLLSLVQKVRGSLRRNAQAKEALVYEHVLVDEAQDLSPVELSVILGTVSPSRSVTLAGDTAQRLILDNGFSNWDSVLGALGLSHVAVEPLKLSYRSTQPIIEFAQSVLGPLADEEAPVPTRMGVNVEMFQFAHAGDAMAFLTDALRQLTLSEPQASVAVIARFPEQADVYYEGLRRSEIPYLRRVADQDFTFKPGVDVTDARQVKGLEFDYVILVEVSDGAYPVTDEARHLLHIVATRAAHQLWVLTTGRPSPLLPKELVDRAS